VCHIPSESAWNWAFIFSCSNDHLGPTVFLDSLDSNGYSNNVVFFGNREVTMFTASQRWSFVNRKLGHQPFRCVLHVTPLRAPAFAVSLSPRWDLVPQLCGKIGKIWQNCAADTANKKLFAAFLGIHSALFCSPM
jgi:hypothetical protein